MRAVPTPDGFLPAWERAVSDPGTDSGAELLRRLLDWLGHGMTADDALSTFIRDNELTWLRGGAPAEFF
jgi:hypothetical protein